jgi:hypothetical protein
MRTHNVVVALAFMLCAACASSGGGKASSAHRIESPEMVSRDYYDLTAASPGRPPTEMKVSYEVMIDETGRPDMSTLKVTGIGSSENRDGIYRWLEHASYKPARDNGQPVAGLLRGRIEARIEVRRMP